MRVHTEIEIDAPADVVWEILSDFSAYPEWNPLLPEVSGPLQAGARLRITLRVPGLARLRVGVRLHALDPGRGFRWVGGPPLVMRGDHGFRVEPLGERRSRFIHDEVFQGVLSQVMSRVSAIQSRTLSGYEQLNLALKDRAERRYNAMHED